ncbi:major royal jelly protein [Fusarium austroafricanum]|uniref:Major royal jelly protein n=1 Tax=Fusarium austroafricanum TaxID=2364996 RepID=A0A8H4NUU6_9HYPO|nr:major royal jelly protein [Fusarium austroafricanum]
MREERKFALRLEHMASLPSIQLKAEQDEERIRLTKVVHDINRPTPDYLIGKDLFAAAAENVKKRWKAQGIWDDTWGITIPCRWKHEERHDSDLVVDPNVKVNLFVGERTQAKSTEEPHRKLMKRCEREASRQFYQFLYQVSAQRDLIQSECRPSDDPAESHIASHRVLEGPIHHRAALDAWANTRLASEELHCQRTSDSPSPSPSPDINTVAYTRVKDTWVKREIWNVKWGVLPGMTWKHEQPLEEMLLEEMGPDPVPSQAEDATNSTEERPSLFRSLGPPVTTSPGAAITTIGQRSSHHLRDSGVLTASLQNGQNLLPCELANRDRLPCRLRFRIPSSPRLHCEGVNANNPNENWEWTSPMRRLSHATMTLGRC